MWYFSTLMPHYMHFPYAFDATLKCAALHRCPEVNPIFDIISQFRFQCLSSQGPAEEPRPLKSTSSERWETPGWLRRRKDTQSQRVESHSLRHRFLLYALSFQDHLSFRVHNPAAEPTLWERLLLQFKSNGFGQKQGTTIT